MRNGSNLSRSHRREHSQRVGILNGDKFLHLSGHKGNVKTDKVAQLLRKTVVDQLARERAGAEAGRRQNRILPEMTSEGGVASHVASGKVEKGNLDELPGRRSTLPTWKRLLDLGVICLTWPLWLPVMILIMIVIKLGSTGPVFYRQERVGHRGRRFMIFKFRTMKVNVETQVHESHFERLMLTDTPMVKLDMKGDPRLIRLGRFLRAAGLDELPQIFNIWQGEMSLVGPRPCTVYEFERYQPWQRERVNAPPGVTGFWQVNGKNNTTFSEMIDMDILYGNNMSLRLDLLILVKTIPAIAEQILASRGFRGFKWGRESFCPPAAPFPN